MSGYLPRPAGQTCNTLIASGQTVVITDMYRREGGKVNKDAGIDLFKEIRTIDPDIDVFCYCGDGIGIGLRERFLKEGGRAITSSPIELLKLIGSPKSEACAHTA